MGEPERQRSIHQKLSGMDRRQPDALSTGFPQLDAVLGIGGLPRRGIVEIFGTASCGKTAFALQAVAHAQRVGLNAAWIDAERAFDAPFAAQLGVAVERMPVAEPASAEEALEVARRLASSGAVDLAILDSAAALIPKLEIEARLGSTGAGLQGRVLASEMRRLSLAVSRSDACVVFLNQTRARMGMGGEGETSSGGPALKLYADVRMVLSAAGRLVRFRVLKNRFAAPYRECELEWRPGSGFREAR